MSVHKNWVVFFGLLFILPACRFRQPAVHAISNSQSGVVVLFNGTSSAGKTAVITELQEIYGTSYTVVSLDNYLGVFQDEHPVTRAERDAMIPEKIDKLPEKLKVRTQQLYDALYAHVKKLALQGKNIFVDTVEFDGNYEQNSQILGYDHTIKILVYCPLDVIVDRVQKRTLAGSSRSLSLIWSQFSAIYALEDAGNNLVVDRMATSRISSKLPLVRKEGELSGQFFENFIEQFKLDTRDQIVLVPKHSWDLIVNTGIQSPQQIAHEIANYLEKRGYHRPTDLFKPDAKRYDQYVGTYRLEDGLSLVITKERTKLFVQPEKQGKIELHPKTEGVFFNLNDAFELSFVKDANGKVIKFILHQEGVDSSAEKVA